MPPPPHPTPHPTPSPPRPSPRPQEELSLLQARERTLAELRSFQESYVPTLRADDLVAARAERRAAEAAGKVATGLPPLADGAAAAALEAAGEEMAPSGDEVAEELLLEAEQLHEISLELDGFCATTIVQRDGLLLPAAPGVVARFQERFYGFVDQQALKAFLSEHVTCARDL